jgi:hypothetical protein
MERGMALEREYVEGGPPMKERIIVMLLLLVI